MTSYAKSFTQELRLVNLNVQRVVADLCDSRNVSDYLMYKIKDQSVVSLLESLRGSLQVVENKLFQVYKKWMLIMDQRILNTVTDLK